MNHVITLHYTKRGETITRTRRVLTHTDLKSSAVELIRQLHILERQRATIKGFSLEENS